jgi:capsular polysaccharide biosynthesis protein
VTAGDVYRALWRHRFVIPLLTAVCVGLTWYVTSLQTPIYEASTLVRLEQRNVSAGDAFNAIQASALLAQESGEIIGSGALDQPVVALVAGRVSAKNVSDVKLQGKQVQNLDLLRISARGPNAGVATIVANAAPQALAALIHRTGTLREDVLTVKTATVPTSPVAPNKGLNIALALVLGLILNGALMLLLEILRDRLPGSDELGPSVGYPVLATIPLLRASRTTSFLRHADDLSPLGGEGFRDRTQLKD